MMKYYHALFFDRVYIFKLFSSLNLLQNLSMVTYKLFNKLIVVQISILKYCKFKLHLSKAWSISFQTSYKLLIFKVNDIEHNMGLLLIIFNIIKSNELNK